MSSDSDRTIDSDELEEIIARAQKEQRSVGSAKGQTNSKTIKRHLDLHGISDSDSDDNIKVRRTEKSKTTKLGNNTEKTTKLGNNTEKTTKLENNTEKTTKLGNNTEKTTKLGNNTEKATKLGKNTEKTKLGKNMEKITNLENSSKKLGKTNIDSSVKHDKLPYCQYGSKCYRKNPDHKKQFYHPTAEEEESEKSSKLSAIGNSQHIQNCQKYSFFVTCVKGIPPKYNVGVSYDIKDLLSLKDGTLVASAQFNYMFDIKWLMQQYPEKYRKCPLTIVHGEQRESKQSLEKSGSGYSNIKFCQAKLDIPFGTHHTKMMFLLYKEGFRVIIHTSNIVESDWAQKTQGMWISPLLPELKTPSASNGESSTNFKTDLLEYVASYSAPQLEEWTQVIKRHDFSEVKVVLVASVPGRHIGSKKTAFGHLKLRKILNMNGPSKDIVQSDWPVIGQFSSIGSLGSTPDQWLCSELGNSLVTCKNTSMLLKSPSLKLIYPSVENVRKSLEGYPAGASLPYSIKVAQKQPYLKSFMHQWKSEKLGRSEASPHIKTYLRLSSSNTKIAWFLVTSANLSKAAWGALEKKGAQFMIRSYEIGVLYLPKYFGLDCFLSPSGSKENGDFFPVPYDIPLQSYSSQDEPWIWDIPHIRGPDRFGNKWCPP